MSSSATTSRTQRSRVGQRRRPRTGSWALATLPRDGAAFESLVGRAGGAGRLRRELAPLTSGRLHARVFVFAPSTFDHPSWLVLAEVVGPDPRGKLSIDLESRSRPQLFANVDYTTGACELDLATLADWEAEMGAAVDDGALPMLLGECSGPWSRELPEAPPSYAAAFEMYLRQTVFEDRGIQFLSGGQLTEDGLDFDAGSTQVVVAPHRSGSYAVVVFRGTEFSDEEQRYEDVLSDVNVLQVDLEDRGWPEGYGEVHRGFLNAYEEVRELLFEKLAQLRPGTPVWSTGHSLGGALATIHGADLLRAAVGAETTVALRGLVTFGCPRVGDARFRDRVHVALVEQGVSSARVRNHRDIVTGIPTIDYAHVGTLLWLLDDGGFELMAPVRLSEFYTSVGDHELAGYWEGIRGEGAVSFAQLNDACPVP